jgi:Cyclin, N-terminal domain
MEVLEQMLLRDEEYAISSFCLKRQRNITPKMREILFDWMAEVCEEFMLKRETLYMSINFLDRYLLYAPYEVPKNELQLIGVSSMVLSCKVEEVYIPRINDFALATDGGYSRDQIQAMESKIMKVLQYKLHPVTLSNWANWYMNMWDVY